MSPGDFRRQFQFLASHFDDVLSINVTEAASGTYNAALSAALTAYDLIEPFMLEFETHGEKTKLSGLYTINEEKLRSLDGASLEKLNRTGFLESIYMVLASIANFRALIDRKAARA